MKPVRQPLSRRRIVLAALALTEKDGLPGVTMRSVAASLQVTPMSLYNHVADKAELLDLMLDYVLGDVVRASQHDVGTWDERLGAVARRYHELWKRHPVFAQVYVHGVTVGPYGLANMERILGILREAGFDDADAAAAFSVVRHFCVASMLVGPVRPVDRSKRGSRSDGSRQGRIDTYFSALPVDEIPNVARSATFLGSDSFEFGLEVLLAGLRARVTKSG
ncbi:MAG TPA: TetR/AcrR family transcriptional regulator C-terminal domain-containing protein [Acidimicrobiales bacterium]|nr:TetR/AcrR family transcriptional regulator C-terminal domain-containing protein [Acidimicrobiales bacterium]